MIWQITILAALVLMALWFGRRRARAPLMPESLFRVVFDADAIRVVSPTGETSTATWNDLIRIDIRTTDDGPWAPDVFWGLHTSTSDTPIVYPGGSTGDNELLQEFSLRLADFRSDQVMSAMGSTTNNHFLVWERRPASSAA